MPRARSEKEIAAAIQSLFRVRGAESAAGPDGVKEVWHQASAGAELLSHVFAPHGRVTRQELVLFDDLVEWTSQKGIRTGTLKASLGAAGSSDDEILFDYEIDVARIRRASEALSRYGGDDKYILHIQRVCALCLSGIELRDEKTVTRVGAAPEPEKRPLQGGVLRRWFKRRPPGSN